ncbi:MAG: hypothetical protein J5637_05370 [Prevotella sp.]|nr:hypothetical protein [Prevotella sp.]
MTCYNCGQDGNGILLDYGRLLLINRRHVPKYVVVDITPKYDLLSTKDGYDMGWLRPYYYDVKGIRDLFADVDDKERYKMLSSSYRYNSFFFMRLVSWLFGKTEVDTDNGFVAKKARFNRMKTTNMKEYPLEYDSLKLKYLSKFIDQASGSSLVFVVSPVWYDQKTRTDKEIKPLRALCEQKGIPLFDFTNHPKYMGNDSLFCDGTHLNHLGADEFSRDIVRILREKNQDVE